jgi:hypothetical protein
MNLVGGGIITALPVGLFPTAPEQTLGHYGAHVIYTLAEVPLVIVAARGLRSSRSRTAVEDAR